MCTWSIDVYIVYVYIKAFEEYSGITQFFCLAKLLRYEWFGDSIEPQFVRMEFSMLNQE